MFVFKKDTMCMFSVAFTLQTTVPIKCPCVHVVLIVCYLTTSKDCLAMIRLFSSTSYNVESLINKAIGAYHTTSLFFYWVSIVCLTQLVVMT